MPDQERDLTRLGIAVSLGQRCRNRDGVASPSLLLPSALRPPAPALTGRTHPEAGVHESPLPGSRRLGPRDREQAWSWRGKWSPSSTPP